MVVLGIAAYEHPLLAGRVVQTLDGETRLYTMPFESDSTMWQLSFPVSEAEARRLGGDAAMLKAEALRRCGGWHTPLPALLAATPEESISGYPVYDREVLTVEKCLCRCGAKPPIPACPPTICQAAARRNRG